VENFDPSRLTAREGRRFAWTLAAAFAVLAALASWRGRVGTSLVLAVAAALFFIAGALAPTRLGPVERAWMSLAHAISRITTPVFMGIVYFLILTPTGLLRRAISRKSISPDRSKTTFWVDRPGMDREALRRRMERQF
jgi:hypothetical protein